MSFLILTINPGSTSTKIGVYKDTEEQFSQNLSHSAAEIAQFANVADQFSYRLEKITNFLSTKGLSIKDFSAIVGRGGLLKPMVSGTYAVNDAMLADLQSAKYGSHASNLGALLANQLAKEASCSAFIVDPVVVDELDPIARISGRPEFPRRSVFHALNQKAVAKRFAKSIQRPYEDLNLIVAHLGGGISVGCHNHGRVVEVNNALDGTGPFSPERAGTIPAGSLATYILEQQPEKPSVAKMLAGTGGLVAHLGTNDAREVVQRIEAGDEKAKMVFDAMIYSVCRYIAAAAVPVQGKVDQIILTGGIAYSKYLTDKIAEYVSFIAPITIMPGEDELKALAEGAYRVLTKEETVKEYK